MTHYTYWLRHKITGMLYYGVHTAKTENELKRYFSSSKLVRKIRYEEGMDIFEKRIGRIFNTRQEANEHEERVHKRLNVSLNPKFLNMVKASAKLIFVMRGETLPPEFRKRVSESKKGKKFGKRSKEWCENISKGKRGITFTEEHKNKLRKPKTVTNKVIEYRKKRKIQEAEDPTLAVNYGKSKPVIAFNESQTFYVISREYFSKEITGSRNFAIRCNQILKGERNIASGFKVRYASDEEIKKYDNTLRVKKIHYIAIGESNELI